MSKKPAVPLDHPVRRRILRQLHADSRRRAVDDLARQLDLNAAQARYHAEVLAKWKTVRQSEDPTGPQVKSLAAEMPEVIAVLVATRSEDER
jgi:predicted ArsR family transcriptional regulator